MPTQEVNAARRSALMPHRPTMAALCETRAARRGLSSIYLRWRMPLNRYRPPIPPTQAPSTCVLPINLWAAGTRRRVAATTRFIPTWPCTRFTCHRARRHRHHLRRHLRLLRPHHRHRRRHRHRHRRRLRLHRRPHHRRCRLPARHRRLHRRRRHRRRHRHHRRCRRHPRLRRCPRCLRRPPKRDPHRRHYAFPASTRACTGIWTMAR